MLKSLRKTALFATVAVMPATVSAQDWSGFYGGLTFGYAIHDATHTFSNGAPTGNSDPEGAMLGAFAGYAIQRGNTVFGAEMDVDGLTQSGTFVNLAGATSGGQTVLNWQGSVRAVLGFSSTMFANPTLFYGTLGYAQGDFDFSGGPAAAFGNRYSDELDGWTVGFGLDTRISDNSAIRVEYRYTDYGTATGTLAPGFPAVVMPVSVEQQAIRVGLRMDF